MKLQTKFNIGIIIIFIFLAAGIAAMSINDVNSNTIREAENRVRIYTRAAWEIHNSRLERIRSSLEILTQKETLRALLDDPVQDSKYYELQARLEIIRQEQEMDILNLLSPDGIVLMRARYPYVVGDNLSSDPLIQQVIREQKSTVGNIILSKERLDTEGDNLVERCLSVGAEPTGMLAAAAVPVIDDGKLIGILMMGSLLNGAADEVDRIRDAVFDNEFYNGKPVGTATIFMGDLRISTNVQDNQGRRAVGTRVSREVAEHVLQQGLSWTGRAFVVDTWYLSQYDPIKDPDGKIIGMLYVGELEQRYLDMRTKAVVSSLSVILVGMVFTFLMSFLFVRNILVPIAQLSTALSDLSNGNLGKRIPIRRRDEVGDLTASFNSMSERLVEQRKEIECRQEELEDLNQQLHQINRNYMEMLGFVSHELKNPLASAIMGLYTVKDGYLGEINQAQKNALSSVAMSLDYFHEMIKNYLDLSRLEKGELVANKRRVSLKQEVVNPVVEGLDYGLQERNMVLEDNIPANVTLNADPDLLKIVYDNLLSNAIKYGRAGGTIELDAHANNGNMTLSVRNDGEGIPTDKMPLLFKKFSRLYNTATMTQKGTGLGLFICKEIVEKHGGQIWVDSKDGKWVKFNFTVPRLEE